MLTRAMGMYILGGDSLKLKASTVKSECQRKACCAFGCTTSFGTGLLLTVGTGCRSQTRNPLFVANRLAVVLSRTKP